MRYDWKSLKQDPVFSAAVTCSIDPVFSVAVTCSKRLDPMNVLLFLCFRITSYTDLYYRMGDD